MPGGRDVAVVDGEILLDVDAVTAGVVVDEGAHLRFDGSASRTLTTTGNVLVEGLLSMSPTSPEIVHTIRFADVDERRFRGGGMDPIDTDVGLWVMGAGRVELVGSQRRAWTRVRGSAPMSSTDVAVADTVDGWRVGDEVVVTPTLDPSADAHSNAYDGARVAGVGTRQVTLDRPLRVAHPSVATPAATVGAEVLNLSRNVRVEGTRDGRAHVFIRSSRPQLLRYVALRHLGPRQATGGTTTKVAGRYALHFHMAGDGARTSLVEGVVARECGNHAFVTHLSNGVTYRGCISHDTFESPYWWDGAPNTRTPGPPSDDVRYESCVASLVRSDPAFRGFRLSGFTLGRGSRNVATGCVATGVQGTKDASGFHWPEGSEGVWTFEDCQSHNNAVHGLFVWQNTEAVHTVRRFTAYHCGGFGIAHGAYQNPYAYEDCVLFRNSSGAVALHAKGPFTFTRVVCDGGGIGDYAVVTRRHVLDDRRVTRFRECSFTGYGKAALGFVHTPDVAGAGQPEAVDVVDCRFSGNELWLASEIHERSVVRLVDGTTTLTVRRRDQPGSPYPEWNASVTRG